MKDKSKQNSVEEVFLNSLRSRSLDFINSSNIFYKLNPETQKYEYISPGIEALTGYTSDELNEIGMKNLIQKIIVDNRDRYEITEEGTERKYFEEYFAKYLFTTKSGDLKWIEDNSISKLTSEGVCFETVGILRDVTSLHDFIDKLHNEKKHLSAILELADVIFIVLNENGQLVIVNQKGSNLIGRPASEIIGKNFREFVPEHRTPETESLLRKILTGKENITASIFGELETITKELRYIEWHYTMFDDKESNQKYIICSGQDVSDSKREEKLQRIISELLQTANSELNTEEFFSYIHNRVSELMKADNFYIALYDEKNNYISFPYFKDTYDESAPPKRFGKGLTEYVIRTGKSALVDLELDAELKRLGEIELLGTQSPIWLGVPLKIQDRTIGVLVVQDYEKPSTYSNKEKEILEVISYAISRAIERKLNEQEREELIVELQELNASKDKLFSAISHDLRSPFNSLLGFSEILTNEYETLTNEEIKEYLNVIYETSKNLFGMTNNLLQYSRFQMGRFEFKPENVRIDKLIRGALNMLKGNALKKQISVMIDIEEDLEVYSDEDMLASVFQNLLSNAIKFTPSGGDIRVSARSVLTPDNEGMLEIKIEDSGIGISSQNIERIKKGEMFTNPGTQKEYGTGLGLLLVREFVEKNGGKIDIHSKINSGTTFKITFPLISKTYGV